MMQYYIAQVSPKPVQKVAPKSIDMVTLIYIPLGIAIFSAGLTALLTLFIGKKLGIFQVKLTREQQEANLNIANQKIIEEQKVKQAILDAILESENRLKRELGSKIDGVEQSLTAKIDGVEQSLKSLIIENSNDINKLATSI